MRLTQWLAVVVLTSSCASVPKPSVSADSSRRVVSGYAIRVLGGDEASFTPALSSPITKNETPYDVIVVGGGIAGLTSAVYLTDLGHRVLLLEKEAHLGGIAAGGSLAQKFYDRGSAYFTDPDEEEQKILERIGLGGFRDQYAIPEPIDSYLWKGKLYLGFWEYEETLRQLPASFEVFKHELEIIDDVGLIPDQPFEDFDCTDIDKETAAARKEYNLENPNCMELDEKTAADWVRAMPTKLATRYDEKSKRIYARYAKDLADGKLDAADPMNDVLGLLELYCRSALGATPDEISAMAFANFYISEIETRYSTPVGTGEAAAQMQKSLEAKPMLIDILTQAAVGKISNGADSVAVMYVKDGKTVEARARFAVFAAQSTLGPKLIEGLAEQDPEKAKIMSEIRYLHYSVHAISVKGHPYRAAYDTWTRAADYTDDDFTDLILGRWMDPEIKGYEGMRDFKKHPKDDVGILTIYHPLGQKWNGKGYTEEQAKDLARAATNRMLQLYSPLLKETWGTEIEVESVETSRWPFSVHVAEPGYFKTKAKILRRPFGRIFFAHNNLGVPSFEEALFRGHCAANNIQKRLHPSFNQEEWTRCPLELR